MCHFRLTYTHSNSPESQHGWCVTDMPAQNGMPIYNKPDAEKAWAKLAALYKSALA